jgi:hypothetical protein
MYFCNGFLRSRQRKASSTGEKEKRVSEVPTDVNRSLSQHKKSAGKGGEYLHAWAHCLSVLVRAEAGVRVGDLDVKLSRSLNNLLSLLRGHGVSNLSGVLPVVHQQNLELCDVVDNKLVEAVRHHVARLRVVAITHVGHPGGATEASADSAINTDRLSPVVVHSLEAIALESLEASVLLLHNRNMRNCARHLQPTENEPNSQKPTKPTRNEQRTTHREKQPSETKEGTVSAARTDKRAGGENSEQQQKTRCSPVVVGIDVHQHDNYSSAAEPFQIM